MGLDISSINGHELEGKKILLCITGSVSSMESPRIARELIKHGADVIPVLSNSASNLIGPELLHWATGNETITSLTGKMEHVQLANGGDDSADLILIAPCTSNTIGKLAQGISDDTISTICTVGLGSDIPIVIASGMHEPMFENPILQNNISILKKNNVTFVSPIFEHNKAKMASFHAIFDEILSRLFIQDLSGKNILVTAGPTTEKIDPIRIITNKSSGKTGLALANEAKRRGANVTLIYGDGTEIPPTSIRTIRVSSSQELLDVTISELSQIKYDFYFASAAPSDFRILDPSNDKISSRNNSSINIELEAYPKIINSIKQISPSTKLIAFKALYGNDSNSISNAISEIFKDSDADFIIVNDVSRKDAGFSSDYNELNMFTRNDSFKFPYASKKKLSKSIFNQILKTLT